MKLEECSLLLQETIKQLEQELNHDDFKNLFKNMNEIHKFENDHIYVVVPDALSKFKIEKFHLLKMNEVLAEITNKNYRYKFIIEDDAKKERDSNANPITTADNLENNNSRRKLRAEFTFDNYVIGESNRFAFISAMKVAESPHSIFNPLYIFGDVGLGKTHLMMAIGHFILDNNVDANVVYTSAQQFTEDYFISTSTKKGREKIEEFYARYRSADVLLVDDIQFLEGKTGTQEEFFKVFDYLHENNKQIVITSDRVANDLKLMARLKSRFNWGMIADIKRPDKDLRVNILKRKLIFLLNNPKDVQIEVLELISELFQNNIRDLEGAIRRYITYCVSLDIPFTVDNVYVALSGILPSSNEVVNKTKDINVIKEVVCSYFRISKEDLVSPSRKSQIVYARNVAIYIIRKHYKTPLKKIGEYFGKRDHATIAHAYDKIKAAIKDNQHTKNDIEFIEKKLEEL
ncbi:MAG: chromosomal replication initiator protein DnaA [Bacilli bacterium]